MKLSYNRINVITLLNDLVAKSLSTCADRINSEQFGSGRRKCEHSDAIGALSERTQCASSREMASIGGAAFSRERRVRVSRAATARAAFSGLSSLVLMRNVLSYVRLRNYRNKCRLIPSLAAGSSV